MPANSPAAPSGRLRILFVIRSLDVGGAERQLAALARGLPPERFEVAVASMYAGGTMRDEFARIPHVRLVSLDKAGRWDTAGFLARLTGLARAFRPHVVHGYMSGANELALLAARSCGARAVWGIRVSDQDFSRYTRFRRAVYRAGIGLSRLPDLIIANSHAGRDAHVREGYRADRFIVIPNGIDVARFRRDEAAGARWRAGMGYAPDDLVIAYPARFDPMKDHATFLAAAAAFAREAPEARFVCAGGDPFGHRDALVREAAALGLGEDRVRFVPAVQDVVSLYSGIDVLTSASAFGEGFPNVLGEAMACEVPCVTTPSGDAALVVGDPADVVPLRTPDALVAAWRALRALGAEGRRAKGARGRDRIHAEFTTGRLVARSAAAFEALARGRPTRELEAAVAAAAAP